MAQTVCPRCRIRLRYYDDGVVAGLNCPGCDSIVRVRPFGTLVGSATRVWLTPTVLIGSGVLAGAAVLVWIGYLVLSSLFTGGPQVTPPPPVARGQAPAAPGVKPKTPPANNPRSPSSFFGQASRSDSSPPASAPDNAPRPPKPPTDPDYFVSRNVLTDLLAELADARKAGDEALGGKAHAAANARLATLRFTLAFPIDKVSPHADGVEVQLARPLGLADLPEIHDSLKSIVVQRPGADNPALKAGNILKLRARATCISSLYSGRAADPAANYTRLLFLKTPCGDMVIAASAYGYTLEEP